MRNYPVSKELKIDVFVKMLFTWPFIINLIGLILIHGAYTGKIVKIDEKKIKLFSGPASLK